MNLTIPIYIQGHRSGDSPTVYEARPLFAPAPVVRGEKLDRLMVRLAHDLDKLLARLAEQQRHDALARWSFCPPLSQQRLELTLLLRRRTVRCRFFLLVLRHFGRRIVLVPNLPEVWFDLARGEQLRDRAVEVLTHYYRTLEREESDVKPEAAALTGTALVETLDVSLHGPSCRPRPPSCPSSFWATTRRCTAASSCSAWAAAWTTCIPTTWSACSAAMPSWPS